MLQSEPHLIDSVEPKNGFTQQTFSAYQDPIMSMTGAINNWTGERSQANQYSNIQSQPQVITSQQIQNYRQLQNRQTRRIINPNQAKGLAPPTTDITVAQPGETEKVVLGKG